MKIRFLFMVTQMIAAMVSAPLSGTLFAQSKGGRWQFEMNGNDTADWDQVDNNGSLSGNALYGSDDPLQEGSYYLALEDTGQYDHFYVPDSYDLDFGNGDIALAAWIYPETVEPTTQYLVVKGDHEATPYKTNNYALRLAGAYLNFNVADASGTSMKVVSSFTVQIEQWNFVAAFYDYSDSVVYLWKEPGVAPTDTCFFNADLVTNANRLYIGAWGQEGYRKFTGRIDDMRIGTRVEEIMESSIAVREAAVVPGPKIFRLKQNYPNPFNPETIIAFDLLRNEHVSLDVYSILGRKVATLVDQKMNAGSYAFPFDAADLASGFYFYRIQAGHENEVRRMVLMK
ncbi:MAG: LamG-like jellyroll fold domain-containing protein [Candidatus Neomarinimicrobiota bacterium]